MGAKSRIYGIYIQTGVGDKYRTINLGKIKEKMENINTNYSVDLYKPV